VDDWDMADVLLFGLLFMLAWAGVAAVVSLVIGPMLRRNREAQTHKPPPQPEP